MSSAGYAVLTVLVIAIPLVVLAWAARRVRERRLGGGLLGVWEEIYHPAAHRNNQEMIVYDRRAAPAPVPGDPAYRDGVTAALVAPVSPRDTATAALLDALTGELALGGYTDDETFGYSADQLERSGVHLVGARLGGELVGVGGIELQDDDTAELKRFYVSPAHRGAGVADAVIGALLGYAGDHGVRRVRLETGDKQHAAMRFYARHGFAVIDRFGPYVDSATSVCMERVLS